MKIRATINNNADKFAATVYEDSNKIIVIKRDTYNYYDNSTDERFEFSTVAEYSEWLSTQDWINKTEFVSRFKGVPHGDRRGDIND